MIAAGISSDNYESGEFGHRAAPKLLGRGNSDSSPAALARQLPALWTVVLRAAPNPRRGISSAAFDYWAGTKFASGVDSLKRNFRMVVVLVFCRSHPCHCFIEGAA